MKKKTINAFTLVEMLIVIVIIGILIAALMPRMQAAQWRARDVSRKTALSQLQSAIVTSQWDKWEWPGMWTTTIIKLDEEGNPTSETEDVEDQAKEWMNISQLTKQLMAAGMNSIPKDPLSTTTVKWITTEEGAKWEYRYIVVKRNSTPDAWFVLMAKTEVEWGSNRVVCETENWEVSEDTEWLITNETDIASSDFILCSKLEKVDECSKATQDNTTCKYQYDNQLRYIVTY